MVAHERVCGEANLRAPSTPQRQWALQDTRRVGAVVFTWSGEPGFEGGQLARAGRRAGQWERGGAGPARESTGTRTLTTHRDFEKTLSTPKTHVKVRHTMNEFCRNN